MGTRNKPEYTEKPQPVKKKTKKKSGSLWIIPVLLLIILAAAFALFKVNYILLDGKPVKRDSETVTVSVDGAGKATGVEALLELEDPKELDLRGMMLSAADFDRLRSAFPGCRISWNIPLSGGPVDSGTAELALSSLTDSDLALFPYFTALKNVDAGILDCTELLRRLESVLPAGCGYVWTIGVGSGRFAPESESINPGADVTAAELAEKLPCFEALQTVDLTACPLATQEQIALAGSFPELRFLWDVELGGKRYASDVSEISLAGQNGLDAEALCAAAPLLPELKTLDITGCFGTEDSVKVAEAFENADVVFTFTLYETEVCSTDEEVDFSGKAVTDGAAGIEAVLPAMKHLTKVVMSDCGLSDEEMDALNKRHEDVRFVWTVYFATYYLRTDATGFIASLFFGYETDLYNLTDETIAPIRYCTALIALDVGHQKFSNLDFVRDMKDLKYLVVADGKVEDISALRDTPSLYFLELFLNPVTDLSPLVECKELRHLNICHVKPDDVSVLGQLTWLDRLWWMSIYMTQEDYAYSQQPDFLPDTEKVIAFLGTATGGTWRLDQSYYDMRDLLGAYYMPGGTEFDG